MSASLSVSQELFSRSGNTMIDWTSDKFDKLSNGGSSWEDKALNSGDYQFNIEIGE